MGSKVPHPAKAFGTGICSLDIDADFRQFKEECEKDDSETREGENQRKLEKENQMRLITFDSQLDEAKCKLFLEKHIDKIVNVVKNTRPRKAPKYICDEALDTDHFNQCTKFSLCEKAEKIIQEFYFTVNTRNLRNTFRKDCRQDHSFQDTKQLLHTVSMII